MSLQPYDGFIGGHEQPPPDDEALPIFNIERVQLQFPRPSDFAAAQVANNAIILAFNTGRILRIDLENAGEIEGVLTLRLYQLEKRMLTSYFRH